MIRTLQLLCCTLLMLAPLALTGCSDNDKPLVVSSLSLSNKAVAFDATGGSATIEITPFPDTERWEIGSVGENEWFNYDIDGNNLTISVDENLTTTSRRAEVVITSPTQSFDNTTLTILQEGASVVELSCSAAQEHIFDSEGDTYTFNIASNYAWSVTVDKEWITIDEDTKGGRVSLIAEANTSYDERSATATITAGKGDNIESITVALRQGTHDDNPYFKLLGKWEITADKWFYTTNGSLNSVDGSPSAQDHYLIFDIVEGDYNENLYMRNFLYPGTSLQVRYNPTTKGFVIPFGWSVYAYEVFLYITLVSNNSFSYAALEVAVEPSADYTLLTPKMPSVSGYNYVGFGLWAYNDNGGKEAFGSSMYPTVYPMGNIKFIKYQD
ncbi:MAG: BACON domain-containing protein [Alistipes sp.]|nr:BACON domain-containing protein [Alistipes sp.]